MIHWKPATACWLLWVWAGMAAADETKPVAFDEAVAPLLKQYCSDCHNARRHEADFRLDGIQWLQQEPTDVQRWEKVLEMVGIGDMPPKDEPQPTRAQRDTLTSYIQAELHRLGRGPSTTEAALPKFANRLRHEDLFSGEFKGPAYTPARVWRVNSHIYSQLVADLELGKDFVPPLNAMQGEGFDDYAVLYADEAAIRTMIQNGKRIADTMVHGRLHKVRGAGEKNPQNKSRRGHTRHRVFADFATLPTPPSRERMTEVVRYAFDVLLHRSPTGEELERYLTGSLEPNIKAGGADAGLRGMLVTLLLSPEFLFRMEMGLGERLPDGRRMLSPHELAFALSFALHDHPVPSVLEAADAGRLSTREDVEREVRALLESDRLLRGQVPAARRGKNLWQVGKLSTTNAAKPRLLRFFREYFDYPKAEDVFKDDIRHGGTHQPRNIVQDADWLVLCVLHRDRRVLEELLTTDHFPVFSGASAKGQKVGYATVYNLAEPGWLTDRPIAMPAGQRAGILTHPAWLVAHSGNFETDPVRRGRWIQEHLLGGVVPDLPIGVEAQLPEDPQSTIRQRFHVVRKAECWRCHKKMNPLGEPFEIYDDFGRYRDRHHVNADGRVLASVLEVGHRRRESAAQPLHPVDAGGRLEGAGDADLDGDVENAIDLMQRLAKSQRVRQVFIRHVFRFWMGRNETLDDSPTLIAMDRAYVESDGSFNETLVTLLTSDSFLYRK